MLGLIERLYPICRSITGDGVRETLRILSDHVDLTVREVESGTEVFDWSVPNEWNVRDAYIKDSSGRRVVDFRESNLHLMSYSVPFHGTMTLDAMRPHLYTLPEQPNAIPYRTSYYAERWGFCLSQRSLDSLAPGEYEVCVDTSLEPGHLTYGECVIPGESPTEVLVHTHVCHPSLANDNLSGIAVACFLASALAQRSNRYTYRFVFAPGTIGAITWLARNEARLSGIEHGLILSGLGDPGALSYKKSRSGTARVDDAAAHVLSHWPGGGAIEEFSPYGYDERQYCSPGIDLPMGRLGRSRWGSYPEYHTSLDDVGFVQESSLEDALAFILEVLAVLEGEATYRNLSPKGEPQLGRRGLYGSIGGESGKDAEMALLWVLNQSDGTRSLLEIAERANIPFARIHAAADSLVEADLLAVERTGN